MSASTNFVLPYSQLPLDNISFIGKTGARIALLRKHDFPLPDGFVITAKAYDAFIKANQLETPIIRILEAVDYQNLKSLEQASQRIIKLILSAKIPKEIVHEIFDIYKAHSGVLSHAFVDVFSSEAYETLLELPSRMHTRYDRISGDANLLLKIQELWASLFSPQAILVRHQYHISHDMTRMAVCVQEAIDAEKTGVVFTADPENGNAKKVVIRAVFGVTPSTRELVYYHQIQENTSTPVITPDTYRVEKHSLEINEKYIGKQDTYVVYEKNKRKEIRIAEKHRVMQKINDETIIELASLATRLEKLYYFPQVFEWAMIKKNLYVLDVYPYTPTYPKLLKPAIVANGEGYTRGIRSGPIKYIVKEQHLSTIQFGDILIIRNQQLHLFPYVKKAAGIIIEKNIAITPVLISLRTIGIPIVMVENLTHLPKDNSIITINGITGDITLGGSHQKKQEISDTPVKTYAYIASKDDCYSIAGLQADAAYIASNFLIQDIAIHPKKIIHDKKTEEYSGKIAEGISEICHAFSPRTVIYELSSLTTTDYKKLALGRDFEPTEENPLLGYRGAVRHTIDKQSLNLELETIRILRQKMNYKHVSISIPFVRIPGELTMMRKHIAEYTLYRSDNFKIWLCIDLVSNILFLEEYIKIGIDGLVINMAHLFPSYLQIDTNNKELMAYYSNQYNLLTNMINQLLQSAKKNNLPVLFLWSNISASSLEQLIEAKIDGLIVPPEGVAVAREMIGEIEKRISDYQNNSFSKGRRLG